MRSLRIALTCAKQRLRREYDATTARFGTSIDDLAPYVVLRHAS